MLSVEKHLPAPHGIAAALPQPALKLELPYSERGKSRLRAVLPDVVLAVPHP